MISSSAEQLKRVQDLGGTEQPPPIWGVGRARQSEEYATLGGTVLRGNMMDDLGAERDQYSSERRVTKEEILERYEKPTSNGWIVNLHDLPEGVTAYNASKVFQVDETPHMFVRQEGMLPDEEFTSHLSIWWLSEDGRDGWAASISNLAELTEGKITQDPAYSNVNGLHVVTWVEVELNDPPDDPTQPRTFKSFKSVTAVGETLDALERLTETVKDDEGNEQVRNVELMDTKCLRYAGLSRGRIAVTLRTSHNGEYKMHFGVAGSWEEITTEFLESTPEIKGLEGLIVNSDDMYEQMWMGGNDMETLVGDDVSFVFHTGEYERNGIPDYRVYDGGHCILVPGEGGKPAEALWPKIISRAKDFGVSEADLPSKRPDVSEVEYPSGHKIARNKGGETILWAGLRDAGQVGQMIPDVLKEWREAHPEHADNPFPEQLTDQQRLAA